MRRRHALSDAARQYRSAMWLLAGVAVIGYAVGVAGVRGSVPRLPGLLGLSLGVAATVVAFFFGLKSHNRALTDQEVSSRRSMIVLLAAELGSKDDETLASIVRRGGPAAEAATLILKGRRERRDPPRRS
jgi:hypothetical protein